SCDIFRSLLSSIKPVHPPMSFIKTGLSRSLSRSGRSAFSLSYICAIKPSSSNEAEHCKLGELPQAGQRSEELHIRRAAFTTRQQHRSFYSAREWTLLWRCLAR